MRCCRRRRRQIPTVGLAESAIDCIVGEQPDATVLQAVLAEVLTTLEETAALFKAKLDGRHVVVQVPPRASIHAIRVMAACGIDHERDRLKAHSTKSIEVLEGACQLIRQLLLSFVEEELGQAPPRTEGSANQQPSSAPVAPCAGAGDQGTDVQRTDGSPGPSSSTRDGTANGTSRGSPPSPEAVRGSEPKVLSFQRFNPEKLLVDHEKVAEINRLCAAKKEKYVDPQFPPSASSLYMSLQEEHTWECLSCHTHSKLGPVPPLAGTQEEVHQQEEDFKKQAICEGCGQPAHHVVQVRYFTRPTQWLRPGRRCEGCELLWGHLRGEMAATMCTHYLRDSVSQTVLGMPWKVIREVARPEDVCQGALGNCWFAGALSVVAQLPQLIDRICLTKELNPNGVYHLRLCHAGQWLDLVVDDLFPTSQVCEGTTDGRLVSFSRGGNLCYLGGARRQLWPPLVEKAAAKLFGCYGALKGGTFAEALALFTGYPTQKLRLYIPKMQRMERAQRRQAKQERRTQLLLQGQDVPDDQSDDSDDDDLNWSKLVSCKDAGYLLGLGCSEESCEKPKHHIVEEMGLQAPHAYGILDLAEVNVNGKTEHLVKIRNPWGQNAPRTWKGKWGKDWDGWTPELQKQLKVVNSSGVLMDDPMSIFWMAFEDLKEYFSHVEICRVHHDWHEARERAWLSSSLGPGQVFRLGVQERSNVDLAFWQERNNMREGALNATCTNVDVGLVVLLQRGTDAQGDPQYEFIGGAPRSFEDCVSVEVILEAGLDYLVVPLCMSHLYQQEPRQGILAVHSVKPITLTPRGSSWREMASGLCCSVQGLGKSWNHNRCPAIYYWHHFEPGGCNFMVENSGDEPVAVQIDATESMGCVSSQGEMGVVVRVPPQSRRIVVSLTFSLDMGWASASIQPQLVPLEMAPAVDTAASDNVHMPLPLAKEWARAAAEAKAADQELAEAIRLSLAPAPRGVSAKEQLDRRTKDLFELYRSQGVAPHEAAQRAAGQARLELEKA